MRNQDIAVLVRAAQEGGEPAFEALYQATWDTVYFYCRKFLEHQQDAEDAAQEVLLRVYRNVGGLRAPEAFNTWLHKIMVQVCGAYRKQRDAEEPELVGLSTLDEEELENDREFLPESALMRRELRERVAELVERLPPKQKEAVLLYYFSGLKQSEICEVTDSALSAVNKRLVDGRRALREASEQMFRNDGLGAVIVAQPLLTRILQEEMANTLIPDVGVAFARTMAAGRLAGGGTARAPSPPKIRPDFLTNLLLGTAVAAAVAGGGMLAYEAASPPTPPPRQTEQPDALAAALAAVTTPDEWAALCEVYPFTALTVTRTEDGEFRLYAYPEAQRQIFAVTYSARDGDWSLAYRTASPGDGVPADAEVFYDSTTGGEAE